MEKIKLMAASAVVFGMAVASGGSALAYAPQLFYTKNTGQSLGNPPFTLGWDFTADKTFVANGLGFFDSGQDGLVESHPVGLWDSSGNLLASTTVTTNDPLVNQWRYASISPVTLTAGDTYFLGALYLDGNDPNTFPNDPGTTTTTGNITYLGSEYAPGSSLTMPTFSGFGGNAYYGPNISAVPEPATWGMMLLGFACLGLGGYRASRREAALSA